MNLEQFVKMLKYLEQIFAFKKIYKITANHLLIGLIVYLLIIENTIYTSKIQILSQATQNTK